MQDTSRPPALLWLSFAYWTVSGLFGIAPFVLASSAVLQLRGSVLAFAGIAALTHVLSLVGATLLVLRRRLAVPVLLLVFILAVGAFLAVGKSPAELDAWTAVLWLIGAATLIYAGILIKRGVLR